MSECKFDHSLEDVKHKYESQLPYLPEDMEALFECFLEEKHSQEILNEVFHLLKKYDLASDDEKSVRNNRLYLVLQN